MLKDVIIDPLSSQEQYQRVKNLLDKENLKLNNKGKLKSYQDGIGIKINKDNTYCLGWYENYEKYVKDKNTDYKGYSLISYDDLKREVNKNIESNIPVETFTKTEVKKEETTVDDNIVILQKDKLVNAYRQLGPGEIGLKTFLNNLFDRGMFTEKLYKVGDQFDYNSRKYAIIKVNTNVITLIETMTFENFCNSKLVKDPYHITDTELRCLLGVYYDKFKLIEK